MPSKRIIILSIVVFFIVASTVFALLTNNNTDVVGNIAVTSFGEILSKEDLKVIANKNDNSTSWELKLPSEDRFRYNVYNTEDKSAIVEMIVRANSLIDAGLDTEKLPEHIRYDKEKDELSIKSNLGDETYGVVSNNDPTTDFRILVENYRERIEYHQELDHYGIDLGNGNKFEWAKDADKNDKDIVFVLDPKPFLDAGLDTEKLSDFVYAEVPVMNGQKVNKLLKVYNTTNEKKGVE